MNVRARPSASVSRDAVGGAEDVHTDPVDAGLPEMPRSWRRHGDPVGRRLPGRQVADRVVQALGGDPGRRPGRPRGGRRLGQLAPGWSSAPRR